MQKKKEKKRKNQNKTFMAKAMSPSKIHMLLIGSPGIEPMYPFS